MKQQLVSTTLGLILTMTIVSLAQAGADDKRLDIYWVDVEGGAATLIVTPLGESILIDTGNPGRRDSDRIVQVAAKSAKLKQIDHLLITHYHRDHFGGAATLATMIPIKNVYDNGVFDGMPDDPGKEYFGFKCEKRIVLKPGDAIPLKSSDESKLNCNLFCLGCRKQYVRPDEVHAKKNDAAEKLHKPKDRDGSDNANSLVMLLGFGPFQFFDAGDLTWNEEFKLVHPFNLVGEVDVYQVTHHGLDSSNNPAVLQTIKPRVAIMNNGVTKGCAPDVFANLKATKSIEQIYQLHKNLRPDGETNNVADEFIANHQQDCKGHFIKLSVDPTGKTYTVSIPAHQHERQFETK